MRFNIYPDAVVALRVGDYSRTMEEYLNTVSPTGHRDGREIYFADFEDAAAFGLRFGAEVVGIEQRQTPSGVARKREVIAPRLTNGEVAL